MCGISIALLILWYSDRSLPNFSKLSKTCMQNFIWNHLFQSAAPDSQLTFHKVSARFEFVIILYIRLRHYLWNSVLSGCCCSLSFLGDANSLYLKITHRVCAVIAAGDHHVLVVFKPSTIELPRKALRMYFIRYPRSSAIAFLCKLAGFLQIRYISQIKKQNGTSEMRFTLAFWINCAILDWSPSRLPMIGYIC